MQLGTIFGRNVRRPFHVTPPFVFPESNASLPYFYSLHKRQRALYAMDNWICVTAALLIGLDIVNRYALVQYMSLHIKMPFFYLCAIHGVSPKKDFTLSHEAQIET